jgi:hypothetical protein
MMTPAHLVRRLPIIPVVAALAFIYSLTTSLWVLSTPVDGWRFSQEPDTGQVFFTEKFTSAPSTLKVDDELLAVDGWTIPQIDAAVYSFRPIIPRTWVDGGSVIYTIVRDGQTLDVRVPVHRMSANDILALYAINDLDDLPSIGLVSVGLIGLLVFWKRPHHLAAQLLLLVAAGLLGMSLSLASMGMGVRFTYIPLITEAIISPWPLFVFSPLTHLLLAFPVQKRVLRDYPLITLALIYLATPFVLTILAIGYTFYSLPPSLISIGIGVQTFLPILIILVSTIHTFQTVHEPLARAQAQWVTLGIMGMLILTNIGWIVPSMLGGSKWFWVINMLGYILLPVCLGIAILRYRLWDIDLLIRRTLTYSVITALLALIYFGGIVILQNIFVGLTGQNQSQLVTVISTLTIAALFLPLRTRVQEFIDRRFYRQKYDAAKTLADFATAARDETDLEKLTARLVSVVDETMQPQTTQLLLKE